MTPSLLSQKRDWEDLAGVDPLWSILSDPAKRFSNWKVDEFFSTGEKEISEILIKAKSLGYPMGRDRAFDFGCGVGRLARALAKHFQECYGMDISEKMISLAKQFNEGLQNCRFLVNVSDGLEVFPSNHFDLIYSNIVLQHIPRRRQIRNYICEFVRVLRVGGLLVFQLPSHIPLRNRIQLRARLYVLLRRVSVSPGFLYGALGLYPIRMNFLPEPEITTLLESRGARVLDVRRTGSSGGSFQSCLYFVTK